MAERSALRALARRAARRVARTLLRPRTRGRDTDPRSLKGGTIARLAGDAVEASVPKNASGNNASVR